MFHSRVRSSHHVCVINGLTVLRTGTEGCQPITTSNCVSNDRLEVVIAWDTVKRLECSKDLGACGYSLSTDTWCSIPEGLARELNCSMSIILKGVKTVRIRID